MSTAEGGGTSPGRIAEDAQEMSSDTESGSSFIGSAAPDTPACPYQDSQYFGHECSRYHDCPTHMEERSSQEDKATEAETGSRPAPAEETETAQDSGTQMKPETHEEARTTEQDPFIPSEAEASIQHEPQTQPGADRPAEAPVPGPSSEPPLSRREQDDSNPEARFTLQEALDHVYSEASIENGPSSEAGQAARHEGSEAASGGQPPPVPSSTRPQPPTPAAPPFGLRRRDSDFMVPRWQPDAEVTYCPICHTQFSFFARKHHCRKCGRVVCNACSPHRITIPHQYIVRPPTEQAQQRYSFMEGGIADFNTIGGGERVRLCNPCVPDPNTTPPQSQHSPEPFSPTRAAHMRAQSNSTNGYGRLLPANQDPMYYHRSPLVDPSARSRSATLNNSAGLSRIADNIFPPTQNRILAGTPPGYSAYMPSGTRYGPSGPVFFRGSRRTTHGGVDETSFFPGLPLDWRERSLPPPPPPAPQIPEEDECPVCHRELPSRDLPNFETLRESHVQSCITAHSTYSPTPGPSSGGSRNRNQPGGSGAGGGNRGIPPIRTARRTGMFPYTATEKDCVDSAECTICLEEFEVGVPMARLECLCRFHRLCINAWFVDHPGRCPVHQHDSFGY
ncbi:FYVE-domain-containing protein [Xylariomycetidae sp. FL2044]|nr:FYVE-domain-containing protein [Xylariomycetidae sp. FL2044]